jgi:hypothetical protein
MEHVFTTSTAIASAEPAPALVRWCAPAASSPCAALVGLGLAVVASTGEPVASVALVACWLAWSFRSWLVQRRDHPWAVLARALEDLAELGDNALPPGHPDVRALRRHVALLRRLARSGRPATVRLVRRLERRGAALQDRVAHLVNQATRLPVPRSCPPRDGLLPPMVARARAARRVRRGRAGVPATR